MLRSPAIASYSYLKCAFCVRMSVFVLVCVISPTDNLPNSISTPWFASWWKTQHITVIEASKQPGSEVADSTRSKNPWHPSKKLYDQRHIKTWINQPINLKCKARRIPSLVPFALVSSIWQPAWGGGGGRKLKQLSPIFWIWTAVPFTTASCQY